MCYNKDTKGEGKGNGETEAARWLCKTKVPMTRPHGM